MKKKLFSILIASLFLLSLAVPASANSNGVSIQDEMEKIEEKYEAVEITSIDTYDIDQIDESMKFESIEEFEEFISKIISEDKKIQNDVSIAPRQKLFNNFAAQANLGGSGSMGVSWFSPIVGATFNWKNIDFSYDYEHGSNSTYLTNIYNISSYISGVHIAIDWHQTSTSGTMWSGNTAYLQIDGYYLGAAEILGVPVGVKVNATWNRSVEIDLPILV